MERSYSEKFEEYHTDMDLLHNKNTNFLSSKGAHLAYVLTILIGYISLKSLGFSNEKDIWTVCNVVHGVISFTLLHWIKGNPDSATQGIYDGLTLYEQIDAGVSWTWNKKFLMLVPSFLTLGSLIVAEYEPIYVIANLPIFVILLVAKLPQMHRVRILGINSTPGIDNKVTYSPERAGGVRTSPRLSSRKRTHTK
jgi:hypothetical protein